MLSGSHAIQVYRLGWWSKVIKNRFLIVVVLSVFQDVRGKGFLCICLRFEVHWEALFDLIFRKNVDFYQKAPTHDFCIQYSVFA